MGLLVGDHLRPVLERAQRRDRRRSGRPRPRSRDVAGRRQGRQRVQRAAGAQARDGGRPGSAAGSGRRTRSRGCRRGPSFRSAPGAASRSSALQRVDLALDRMDVGDGGEVEVAPPDEGLQLGQEGLAAADVAGADAGLDERRPLPVLADALVVVRAPASTGTAGGVDRRDRAAAAGRRGRRSRRRSGPAAGPPACWVHARRRRPAGSTPGASGSASGS